MGQMSSQKYATHETSVVCHKRQMERTYMTGALSELSSTWDRCHFRSKQHKREPCPFMRVSNTLHTCQYRSKQKLAPSWTGVVYRSKQHMGHGVPKELGRNVCMGVGGWGVGAEQLHGKPLRTLRRINQSIIYYSSLPSKVTLR